MEGSRDNKSIFGLLLIMLAGMTLPGSLAWRFTPTANQGSTQGGPPKSTALAERTDKTSGGDHARGERCALCLLKSYLGCSGACDCQDLTQTPPKPKPTADTWCWSPSGPSPDQEKASQAALVPQAPVGMFCRSLFETGAPSQETPGTGQACRLLDQEKIEILLATVPEPSWGVDGQVEALVRAFDRTGYNLTRSWLPWRADGQGQGTHLPGVLLFTAPRDPRCSKAQGTLAEATPCGRSTYVVFLVEETPSGGVKERAFRQALEDWQFVRQEFGLASQEPLKVLGPSFSGSADSLSRLLHRLRTETPTLLTEATIQVYSGRATDDGVKKTIESAFGPPKGACTNPGEASPRPITYQATVRSDEAMQYALLRYLTETLKADRSQIALIVESSTGYGKAAVAPAPIDGPLAPSCPEDPQLKPPGPQPVLDGILLLPIPYNLASLHDEWDKRGHAKPAELTEEQRLKALGRTQDSNNRRGVLPVLSPTTAMNRDLALSAILNSIQQEGIRYVGLMLTSPEDKHFLAERLSVHCPDVRLFTFESEIQDSQPEDQAHLRGMIVASTYPLFSRNQQWTYPYQGSRQRLQFASQTEQGVYNATLFLLGEKAQENLLEYGPPDFKKPEYTVEKASLRPPVWISAVGRDGLFPLAVYCTGAIPTSSNGYCQDDYLATASVASTQITTRWQDRKYAPYDMGMMRLLLVLLACIAGLHVAAYFCNTYGKPLWVSSPGTRPRFFDFMRPLSRPHTIENREEFRQRGGYLLWMFGSLAVLLFYMGAVVTLRFRRTNQLDLLTQDFGFAMLAALSLALVGAALLDITASLLSRSNDRHREAMRPLLRWEFVFPVSLVAAVVVFVLQVALASTIGTRPTVLLLLRRSARTEYELSPLMPIFLLGAVAYLWGLFNLRRQRLLLERPVFSLPSLGPPALAKNLAEKIRELRDWLHIFRWHTRIGVVIGVLVVTWPVFGRLTTLESYPVTLLFKALFIGVMMLVVLTTVRFWSVWRLLRDALTILKHHPLTDSLGRLPRRVAPPLGTLLLEEVPRLTEETIHRQQLHVLFSTLPKLEDGDLLAALGTSPKDAQKALTQLRELAQGRPDGELHGPAIHDLARQAALQLVRLLEDAWDRPPVRDNGHLGLAQGKLPRRDTAGHYLKPAADATLLWLRLAEEVVAMQIVSYLHRVLPHLHNALVFLIASLLLLLAALNSYPFEPIQWATVLVWLLFLGVIGLATQALFQMNRNTVLSRLTRTTPGKINWDLGFVKQLAIYVLVPLISLVSTQLSAFSWLGRLLQNLR